MRLIKAEVVGHADSKGNRFGIYSMDIQPNSNRLATGGGDCCVKLWNLDALLSKPEHAKEALLATLSSHTKSVNVVRWSKDGKYLASGSDDQYILIHKYTPGAFSSQTFGSAAGQVKNKENWSRCYTLQGHSMDILDLDWLAGPTENGYTLASASVDNHIMVWHVLPASNTVLGNPSAPAYASNASSTLISPRKILNGHTSYVRGLAYDPIGRYLISSGSDNRIIVWDVENDYAVLRVLEEPLRNSPDNGIYRRISWSPDGQSVCVTSATKSTKPVGMVLKRGTWESVADLVGHSFSSISTKFYGHVLQPNTSNASNGSKIGPASCAVALGDQNGVVSIWSTQSNRPLYVLREVCSKMVTDIAWSPNPAHTVAVFCGIDGNILIADFEGELGRPMPPAALERHFQSLYGRNIQEIQQRPQALIESTLALKYTQSAVSLDSNKFQLNKAAGGITPTNGSTPSMGVLNSSRPPVHPSTQTQAPVNVIQQQTTQVIGGKKRIRPVLMANNLDSPDEVTSACLGPAPPTPVQSIPSTVAAPVLSSAHSSQSFGTDYGSAGDFDDHLENSALSKRMRQHADSTASASKDHNVALTNRIAPSAGVVAAARQTLPAGANGQISPRSAPSAAPAGATVVERYMSIRFENDEVICTVPLLGSQQRIQRFVKPPLNPVESNNRMDMTNGKSVPTNAGLSGAFVVDPSVYQRSEATLATSAPPTLVITAARLTKPSVLAQLKQSGGSLSSITLSGCDATSSTFVRGDVEQCSAGLWTAVVAGEVTCLAASEAPRAATMPINSTANGSAADSAYNGASAEGLALVGCSDGTVHCLGLGCGMRFTAPMVLGAAVSYLDLQYLPTPSHERDHTHHHHRKHENHSSRGVYTALAVTADGEIWKWVIDPLTAQFRCTVRANLRPALLSMKCRHGTNNNNVDTAKTASSKNTSSNSASKNAGSAGTVTSATSSTAGRRVAAVSIRVESCLLSETGAIQVHLLSLLQSQCGIAASGGAGSAEGGDWQAFVYNAEAMVWTRLADMRYVLSSMFSVKTIGAGATATPAFSSDHTNPLSSGSSADLTSLSALQSLAASGAKFSTKDIMSIAAAKQAAKFGLNNGLPSGSSADGSNSVGSLQALTELASNNEADSNKGLAPNAEDWANLVTIGHVEDRLSVALAVGHTGEINAWLVAWVTTCCKNGLTGRLQWFARQLIAQHLHSAHSPAIDGSSSSITSHGSTSNSTSHTSCVDWLLHLKNPLEILKTVVLPVIAQNPKVHSLLADINQSLELLNLA